jgi:hypothetical protein
MASDDGEPAAPRPMTVDVACQPTPAISGKSTAREDSPRDVQQRHITSHAWDGGDEKVDL